MIIGLDARDVCRFRRRRRASSALSCAPTIRAGMSSPAPARRSVLRRTSPRAPLAPRIRASDRAASRPLVHDSYFRLRQGLRPSAPAALTVVGTPSGCALVADGSARDAPFALVTSNELPAAIARYRARTKREAGSCLSARPICATATAIYERSFAIIRAEADLSRFSAEEADVAVRMIHACGLVEAAQHIVFGRDLVAAARGALARRRADPLRRRDGGARHHARAAAGAQRGDLHAATIRACRRSPKKLGTTRSAAALDLWLDRLAGAVVAIGNAPTALFRLLELHRRRRAEAGGDPRHPGRLRRRRRIEGGARRRSARRAVPDRARPHGRQRHDGGRGQRAGEGRAMSGGPRKADRRRRRTRRSRTDDAQGDARARRGRRHRAFRQGRKRRAIRAPSRRGTCAPGSPSCRCSIPSRPNCRSAATAIATRIRDFYDDAAADNRRASRSRPRRSP